MCAAADTGTCQLRQGLMPDAVCSSRFQDAFTLLDVTSQRGRHIRPGHPGCESISACRRQHARRTLRTFSRIWIRILQLLAQAEQGFRYHTSSERQTCLQLAPSPTRNQTSHKSKQRPLRVFQLGHHCYEGTRHSRCRSLLHHSVISDLDQLDQPVSIRRHSVRTIWKLCHQQLQLGSQWRVPAAGRRVVFPSWAHLCLHDRQRGQRPGRQLLSCSCQASERARRVSTGRILVVLLATEVCVYRRHNWR